MQSGVTSAGLGFVSGVVRATGAQLNQIAGNKDFSGSITAAGVSTIGGANLDTLSSNHDTLDGAAVKTTGAQTVAGVKTFSDNVIAGARMGVGPVVGGTPEVALEVADVLTGTTGAFTAWPEVRITATTDATFDKGDIHGRLSFFSEDPGGAWPGVTASIDAITTRADDNGLPDTGLQFRTTGTNGELDRDMTLTHHARLGIKNTDPQQRLELSENGNSMDVRLRLSLDPTNTNEHWDFGVIGTSVNAEKHRLAFEKQGVELMSLLKSGRLGVGIASPAAKLQ